MGQKVAYVTGGMGGIGTTMCQRLHTDGFTVIAGCGPSRDHDKWITEQTEFGFYLNEQNIASKKNCKSLAAHFDVYRSIHNRRELIGTRKQSSRIAE